MSSNVSECEPLALGGYGPVTGAKRWKDVCRALGHDLVRLTL